MTDDPRTIRVDEFLSHPPAKVWQALTDSELMARWLMPNDFKLEIGHRFTFHTRPIPAVGFGGVGHSEVLDFVPEKMLQIAWRTAPDDASSLDSVVTFVLEPEGTGTRLFVVHDGFDPDDPYQALSRRIMSGRTKGGWKGVGQRISTVIDESLT
ncbi:SRPBCC domain-containing protein [Actinobacteria bacterium YIM 96077]|uniref:SRPBCC domain-containing protein n=1 Tax=Phytoactinopolyspora halophila TaxID=1981511 RepID=A0A329R271_9ACTN|nr:SRPBCC domain-containing protein [Phytoactinopolyspora halophila]AYY12094.1 SRPBCC domain-containing protein [Actinobacteria bacterium YIM 96077]RAW18670.1 SRPBCC domain-containing protein [Phytoactinopolyspora halophila]